MIGGVLRQSTQREEHLRACSIARSIDLGIVDILSVSIGDLLFGEVDVVFDRRIIVFVADSSPRDVGRDEGDFVDIDLRDLSRSLALIFSEDSRSIDIATTHTTWEARECVDILSLQSTEQTLLTLDVREALAAEVRDDKGGDTRYVRTSHRGTLHIAVVLTRNLLRERTEDFTLRIVSVTTRSGDIDPVPTVRVVGRLPVRSHRTDSHDRRISPWEGAVVQPIITSSEDDYPTLHRRVGQLIPILVAAGVLDEVVDSGLLALRDSGDVGLVDIAPRVLADDSTVIGTVDDSVGAVTAFTFAPEDLTAHQASPRAFGTITPSDTSDADTVVVAGCDCTCDVSTVGLIVGVDLTIVMDEVEAVDIVDKAVAIIVDTFLTIELLLIDEEVVLEVWMGDINTTIGDSDDDVRLTCFLFPSLEEADVSTSDAAREAASIVVVPLVAEHRVIEGSCGSIASTRSIDSYSLARRTSNLVDGLSVFDLGRSGERLHSSLEVLLLIEADDVPKVQAFTAHTLLEAWVDGEEGLEGFGADATQGLSHLRGQRTHRSAISIEGTKAALG